MYNLWAHTLMMWSKDAAGSGDTDMAMYYRNVALMEAHQVGATQQMQDIMEQIGYYDF